MEEVDIVFESRELRSKFGVKPRRVTLEVARSYERKGWAKIVSSLPFANPAPTLNELYGVTVAREEKEIPKDVVPFMPEEKLVDSVRWISSARIPKTLIKLAGDAGFDFKLVRSETFSVGILVLSKLIILSSDLSSFSEDKKRHIRALLFQKRIPYIYRIEDSFLDVDLDWSRQAILGAKSVFFASKAVYYTYEEAFGDDLEDYFIEKSTVGFWRKVNDVLKGIKE